MPDQNESDMGSLEKLAKVYLGLRSVCLEMPRDELRRSSVLLGIYCI